MIDLALHIVAFVVILWVVTVVLILLAPMANLLAAVLGLIVLAFVLKATLGTAALAVLVAVLVAIGSLIWLYSELKRYYYMFAKRG